MKGYEDSIAGRYFLASYEVFEALRRGVAVFFRKRDAEGFRNISELKACDKGGMIFQPEPGIYEKVHRLDFTSLCLSIIVKYNLSPETIEHPEKKGFPSTVLSSPFPGVSPSIKMYKYLNCVKFSCRLVKPRIDLRNR